MSRIATVAAAVLGGIVCTSPAAAQDAVGYWEGILPVTPAVTLRIGVTIERNDAGELQGTIDSPDQNSFGIPLGVVAQQGGKLTFDVPAISASYDGTWDDAAAAWTGTFTQAGGAFPLALKAGNLATKPRAVPLPADWTVPDDAALGALLEARIAPRAGAGMVVGVVEPGGTRIVARGPAGAPAFDGDTLFEIGSMTKVFTALLLADMALKGEVALDDPVAKYLPQGASMPERGGKAITLRMLSMQDSGLPRLPDNMPYGDLENPYADYTERHLLDFLAGYELPRDPGAEYEYSNLGVGLLGYALARAAGADYESLVTDRILAPLGMKDTAITLSPRLITRFAPGHDSYLRRTSPWDLPSLPGAGALRSTANDMLKFLRAALDPSSLIAPAMRLTLSDRRGSDNGNQTALGWMALHPPSGEVLRHGGGTGGFRSEMSLLPAQGRAVVVLTNAVAEPSAADIALHALVGAPVAATPPVPLAPPSPGAEMQVSAAQLDHVTGIYELTPAIMLTVRREDGDLFAQLSDQPEFPIFASGPLTYFWRVVDARIRFIEANGKVTGAVFSQNGRDFPIKKVE